MNVIHLILVVLVVLILLSIPWGPGWAPGSWGYYPAGGFGLVVVILLILLLTGRL